MLGWVLFWTGLFLVARGRFTFITGDSVVKVGGRIWEMGCERLDMRG